MIKTTEVTTYEIAGDNVLNRRLFFAYREAAKSVSGRMLEVGCGAGKGLEVFAPVCTHYTALDKNTEMIERFHEQYPDYTFISTRIPPFADLPDNSFDTVVSLQVIEHIEDDNAFLSEIHRVLKPGGRAVITTPNIKLSLSRNPWHIREYTGDELEALLRKYFSEVRVGGVFGNEKVMRYHEENRKSVQKIMRFDIFNLQYKLPRFVLQAPYEILNRLNRNKLHTANSQMVEDVTEADFRLSEQWEGSLDLFCTLIK